MNAEQAISRVLYAMVIHLRPGITPGLMQPTRSAQSGGPPSRRNLHGLAPDRVYHACKVTPAAVGSYPAFSPLPRNVCGAVSFLWHFPYPAAGRINPHGCGTVALGHCPCPSEPGLSSPQTRAYTGLWSDHLTCPAFIRKLTVDSLNSLLCQGIGLTVFCSGDVSYIITFKLFEDGTHSFI